MANQSSWALHEDIPLSLRYTYGSLTIAIAIAGVLGNTAICLAIVFNKSLRNSSNFLIFNLATTDLIQSINMVSIATTLITGKWNYGSSGCQVSGYIVVLSVTSSTLSLALISFDRYTTIQKPQFHRYFFSKGKTWIMIGIIWIIAIFSALPPLLGWTSYLFRQRRALCSLDFHESRFYLMTVSIIVLIIPYIMMTYCYWNIFLIVYHSRRRINDAAAVNAPVRRVASFRKCVMGNELYKTSFILCFVTLLFILVYVPTMVTNLIELADPKIIISPWVDLPLIILAFSNQCINPFIYGFLNKHYRKVIIPRCKKGNTCCRC